MERDDLHRQDDAEFIPTVRASDIPTAASAAGDSAQLQARVSQHIEQVVPGIVLLEVIGQGGFGTVYRGFQQSINREVAVKLDQRGLTSEGDRRRFLREATAMGQVSAHPNIVTLHDGGTTSSNRPYMVMDLCPGGSVGDRLRTNGAMPVGEVVNVGIAIAEGLAAAHHAGILHRDVKPANVMITRYGTPALSDFGIASLPSEWGISSMSHAALTPAYAPPEAFVGEQATPLWDVYSLGATLHSMLIGVPPRSGASNSLEELLRLSREPLPSLYLPQAPGLSEVLAQATAPQSAYRFQSAIQLRDSLFQVRQALIDPNAVIHMGAPYVLNHGVTDPNQGALFSRPCRIRHLSPTPVS